MGSQGYKTFGDTVNNITVFAKNTSSSFRLLIQDKVRQAYRQAVDAHPWQELRKTTSNVTQTAGSPHIYLPSYAESVRAILDLTTLEHLDYESIENLLWKDSFQFNTAGYGIRFADLGLVPYQVDFYSAGETIRVVSSSASDTAVVVRLYGLNADGTEVTETVTTNGTSAVTSSNTYTELYSISTDDTHIGILTYSGTTSLKTYGRIAAHEKTTVYRRLRLGTPALNGNQLAIVYKKSAKDLVNDEDIAEIPVSAYLQEMGMAFALEYAENEAGASVHRQNAAQALAQAIARSSQDTSDAIQSTPVFRPSLQRRLTIERPGG